MKANLMKFVLPVVVLVGCAALVALFAGIGYAIVTLLVGLIIIGGLASGWLVARAEEAPFAQDGDETEAGDTPEHSEVSSANPGSTR